MARSNIQEDEELANVVERYPCLYAKSDPGYMEKDRKRNAWREVEIHLGLEKGEAEKRFTLLKKRYSRKKSDFKKVNVSGTGKDDVTKQKKYLEDYSFMNWLDPHLRGRQSSSRGINIGPSVGTYCDTVHPVR